MAHAKISEYRLARLTGVSQPTIHRILKGISKDPENATLEKIAAYFKMSVDELRGKTQRGVRETTGRFSALTEEALDLLRAFERLPPERQQAYKDFIFLEVLALDHMPWLRRGRPVKDSYEQYERRMNAAAHAAKKVGDD